MIGSKKRRAITQKEGPKKLSTLHYPYSQRYSINNISPENLQGVGCSLTAEGWPSG